MRSVLRDMFEVERYWADHIRRPEFPQAPATQHRVEDYSALECYTTNDGYKRIFGYINQVFRKHDVDENQILGAVALVELLTIDLYNLRLANFGCAKYYSFQGIVHRGLSVDKDVLDTFRSLTQDPLQDRTFSVPLAFVSTSANQNSIQEFIGAPEENRYRLHWKIHIHELEPSLLSRYRARHPDSVVSTICAMPISIASEFPNEQEVLLRGPLFQILRMYEEKARDQTVCVVEMVMLNANRDHGTELAHDDGEKAQQRKHFRQMCTVTKYEICSSLAEKYGMFDDAKEYKALAESVLEKLSLDDIKVPYNAEVFESWSSPRPSWIGASLEISFPRFRAQRRAIFSKASYAGKWDEVNRIIDEEYDWQKCDWCNVPRLHGKAACIRMRDCGIECWCGRADNLAETPEQVAAASGFTVLHQAAYSNAEPELVQKLVDLGAWRKQIMKHLIGAKSKSNSGSRDDEDK